MADTLAQYLAEGSFGPLQVLIAFAGGLIAGFGPCVLPMMPAIFGYITGSVAASTTAAGPGTVGSPMANPREGDAEVAGYMRGLLLAGVFVLGMTMVFTAIGVVAGFLGRAILISGWATYLVAFVLVVLGLHFLGAVQLPVERLNRRALSGAGRSGFVGALILGVLFGLVASPARPPCSRSSPPWRPPARARRQAAFCCSSTVSARGSHCC